MMLRCRRNGEPPGSGCNTFSDSGRERGGNSMCVYLKSLDLRYLACVCAALSFIAASALVQRAEAQTPSSPSPSHASTADSLVAPELPCMSIEERKALQKI